MGKNTHFVASSFFLTNLKLEDMRPKEEFKPGCLVDCIDRPALHDGRILQVDCDNRLAQVEWGTGHIGWWYLKDLVVVGWPMVNRFGMMYAPDPFMLLGVSAS